MTRTNRAKGPFRLAGLAAAALATTLATAPAAQADTDKTLVTVITSDDPQAQLMGMVLTMQAVRQGAQAHILLCGAAGDIALRDAPESATAGQPPRDMSPQGLMTAILKQPGTKAEVCAIYLPGEGLDAGSLIDGVGTAKPDAMAAALMADDARLLSF